MPKAVHSLQSRNNIAEVVVVSTCNRIEVYAVAERFHGAYADIRDFFCELGGLAPDELHPHLYSQHDEAAVTHLFEVAAGLDSAVLGETRDPRPGALGVGAGAGGGRRASDVEPAVPPRRRDRQAGPHRDVDRPFHGVGLAMPRSRWPRSTSVRWPGAACSWSAPATWARASPSRSHRTAVAEMAVANRTFERAATLARRVSGRVAPFADLPAGIADADLVLTCTGSGHIIIDHDMVAAAMSARPHRPLLIVDIAVPRDVDAAVAQIPGVSLLDLDDLRTWAAKGIELRKTEADKVRVIVAEEVERYVLEATSRQAAPLVAQLHERAEAVRAAEVARSGQAAGGADAGAAGSGRGCHKGIVAKLLHGPSVRLKDDVGSPRGERNAAAVRDLFDLQ